MNKFLVGYTIDDYHLKIFNSVHMIRLKGYCRDTIINQTLQLIHYN
jgi:hypothetical protein